MLLNRVLLVEDDRDSRMAMTMLLRRDGLAVTAAGSRAEALRAAEAAEFDVLISDLTLGDGDGHELPRALQLRAPTRSIAVSGHGTAAPTDGSSPTFDLYLAKPARHADLIASLSSPLLHPPAGAGQEDAH